MINQTEIASYAELDARMIEHAKLLSVDYLTAVGGQLGHVTLWAMIPCGTQHMKLVEY